MPSRNPAMNISRSEMEDMSVMHSVSLSKSLFRIFTKEKKGSKIREKEKR